MKIAKTNIIAMLVTVPTTDETAAVTRPTEFRI